MVIEDLDQDRMVAEQIEGRGVRDPRVLEALRAVPRRAFVPDNITTGALGDHALPIGHKQTISQPYIVGKMTELLAPGPSERVLEIGTGSGYQAAVLSQLAKEVYSTEIVPDLAESAKQRLQDLGYRNVQVRESDGAAGWVERAPFDKICVTAAPETLPEALLEQIAEGGRVVAPIGTDRQRIRLWDRGPNGIMETLSIGVRFVPMTGRAARSKGVVR